MKQRESQLVSILQQAYEEKYNRQTKKRGSLGVIYTRVSSQEQSLGNNSLEVQMKYCEQYAQKNNIQIAGRFGGTYESAKTDGRKEFQKMLAYVKRNKSVSSIIITSLDRFSRTGINAAKISQDLLKEGVQIRAVTQEFDNSTSIGALQETIVHMMNNFDNKMKGDRTKINTREVMLKGYWPYHTPLGYKNLKPKQRACDHEYVITEEGKELKKAFLWKAEGKLSNIDIIRLLEEKGVKISKSNFRLVIANPFYAGYITGSAVSRQLIKGKHPALIDLKTFVKANQMMQEAPNLGVPKICRHNEVPLKNFAKDAINQQYFTGYKTKNIWYYKTKNAQPASNVRATVLNDLFLSLLRKYECKKEHMPVLEKYIRTYLMASFDEVLKEQTQLRKQITEKKKQIENIEERFMNDEIPRDLYEKYVKRYTDDLSKMTNKVGEIQISGSNLDVAVSKCLKIGQNLGSAWLLGEYEEKQSLQKLIFPEGVMYDKENKGVRTDRVNSLFECISIVTRVLTENKTGNSITNCLKVSQVPRTAKKRPKQKSYPQYWQGF